VATAVEARKALLHKQVTAAEAVRIWTLQTAILTEDRASIALYHSAGYRAVGIRDRIAQLDGVWHDTPSSLNAAHRRTN